MLHHPRPRAPHGAAASGFGRQTIVDLQRLVEARVALLVDRATLSIVAKVVVVPLLVEALRPVAATTAAAPAAAQIGMAVGHLRRGHRGEPGILFGVAVATAAVLRREALRPEPHC